MSVTVCPSPLTAGAHLWWGIGPNGGHDGWNDFLKNKFKEWEIFKKNEKFSKKNVKFLKKNIKFWKNVKFWKNIKFWKNVKF